MSSQTLYRKYRPQSFKELTGQNHIKITIQNEIETGQLAHAFVFCGPRGIGKTSLARLVAKSLNCQNRKNGQSEPCNDCLSCREITEGRSLAIVEIDAASHTGVENVRENIIASSRVAPGGGNYKVFIIDEAHMLSAAAFNALLKTLEEPPVKVVFILATTEIHKVPLTIISRCQRFDFKKINTPDLIKRLEYIAKREKREVEPAVLKTVALHTGGYLRDAISLLEQILVLDDKKITAEQAELVIPRSDFNLVLELFENLVTKDTISGLKLVNNLVDQGVDLNNFTNDLIEFLRKVLLVKISDSLESFSLELDQDIEKRLLDLSGQVDEARLVAMINNFLAKRQDLKTAEIVQFPLELAVVEICRGIETDQEKDSDEDSDDDQELDNKMTGSGTGQATLTGASAKGGSAFGGKDTKTQAMMREIKAIKDKTRQIIKNKLDRKKEGAIDFEQVQACWPRILSELKEDNHSLFIILNTARLEKLEEETLRLAVKYDIHQSRIQQSNGAFDAICKKVLGTSLKIEAIVKPDLEISFNQPEADNLEESQDLNELLEAFGGKIVE